MILRFGGMIIGDAMSRARFFVSPLLGWVSRFGFMRGLELSSAFPVRSITTLFDVDGILCPGSSAGGFGTGMTLCPRPSSTVPSDASEIVAAIYGTYFGQ